MSERKYPRRFVDAKGGWNNELTHATVICPGGNAHFHYSDGTSQRTCFAEEVVDDCVSRGTWREVFDHEPAEEKIINPNCADIEQLRTQLADARRVISELEAAQGIAVHELGRQRELAASLESQLAKANTAADIDEAMIEHHCVEAAKLRKENERLRELAKARLATIKHLNKLLKAAGVRV